PARGKRLPEDVERRLDPPFLHASASVRSPLRERLPIGGLDPLAGRIPASGAPAPLLMSPPSSAGSPAACPRDAAAAAAPARPGCAAGEWRNCRARRRAAR